MKNTRGAWRQYWVALRAMVVLTVVLGIAYPIAMTAAGQLAFPAQANGSLIHGSDGTATGSSLTGQSFADKEGRPLPQWFQSRPSAAGDGYAAEASSPSNLGPNNPDLTKLIRQRQAQIEKTDGVSVGSIPPDAVTASGSGLDPDISPAYAMLQVKAVADARGIGQAKVRALVESKIQGRDLGYLGEPTVNVLELNRALAAMDPGGNG
jgi:potassium-transporting ATPase KdpC subunit